MNQRRKDKKNINAWLDEETRAKITSGAETAGITKTEFLRQAIHAYAKEIDNRFKTTTNQGDK